MEVIPKAEVRDVGPEPHLSLANDDSLFQHRVVRLSDKPLMVIEPNSSRFAINLRDLWVYRELLYLLAWRDVKVRYKQTLFGVAWVILQPLITTLIFTVILGRLAQIPSDNIPYPLFAYTGLLAWTFFSGAVTNTSGSLVGNANLITKVYFPRVIIPGAAIGARLVDLAIGFVIMAGMMTYYSVAPTWHLILLPLPVALLIILSMALGTWMSALNVKYRDIGAILPTLIQLGMYVSPVVYPLSLVPKRWQWLYLLNPLTGIIKAFRASLLGQALEWQSLAASAAVTFALLVYSAFVFRRMEKQFADIV
jgi:lipopolysaccharide transport system permease protein